MATTVYEVQELTLDDGSTVTCKPASIKVMRKGHEMITQFGESKTDEDGLHRFLDLVCLCLKRQRPDFETDELNDEGEKTGRKVTNYDLMEDLFDYDTMFKVIHLYLGVNFADPKLLEAAAELAAVQAEAPEQPGEN